VNIVVCVKSVPIIEKLIINEEGTNITGEDLQYGINEWDDYALEEALLLKERFKGTVTAVTINSDEKRAETLLRECFAKGIDRAIEVVDSSFEDLDPSMTANLLWKVITDLQFDIILTGVQASDNGYSEVGGILSELLNIPQVAITTHLDINETARYVTAQQELEGGAKQKVKTRLPALFTIQTGINSPRYASLRKTMDASKRKIAKLTMKDLKLNHNEIERNRKLRVKRMFIPRTEKKAKLIEGEPKETAMKLAEILQKEVI
jgi:electron transfer flavoprotein beta subunit